MDQFLLRAAERVVDLRTDEVNDYIRNHGDLHSKILAHWHAPDFVRDRASLWNTVEANKLRKRCVALPSELTWKQNRDQVRGFVQAQFVARSMVPDIALHAPAREDDQHAYIILTTRDTGPEGFAAKNRDWNAKELLVDWLTSWADHVNHTPEHIRSCLVFSCHPLPF